ncbi:2-dehydropantoate 2-reductase [Pseudooceanicola sp.]|uniref:ketopantoate reductase family protein n=1 Tax=Pseudooceanicola sp. TaxID=1914328 RepID=UPI002616D3FF|nr:2-dehydropantoate 2-reductase [Pseudooceanicola sp.]MDF1856856.1 2-dehydropantoate 2-reductase [Pseudooceanicola sp.]
MKIAVMGAGALGGYFGGRLAQAGHDVWLIARGAHLAAIQTGGLRILSPRGDAHLPDIHATGDPAEVGPVDVILFMVKNGDVETAAEAIKPMIRPDTLIVTCQNGISAWERLGAIVGAQHVVPGVARIPGEIVEPGVIRHSAMFDRLIFGEADGTRSERCAALATAMTEAKTTAIIPDNILHQLWSKFVGQSTLASLTTLTQLDIGPLRDNPASRQLFYDATVEAFQVGKAVVPDLPEDTVAENWMFVENLPHDMHASMLDDLRRGKPLEHEFLSGDVVRFGQRHGVATPIHSVLYAALKPTSDRLNA